ncbi:methylated-DNA--[protein]-cysteine S-methyltransferase [Alkalilimnicola sp. S0819]|uniref:methylated-DNA--[protein]-cysteine S-methyltransferase n=1 Tax=Alkalilimnicola sp. S0819 TaxID=2613922 RepID=UPI0012619FDB|nr:methylated-DNA--[protein]-cysteine S-methyltransferase [Alkalilimnicola sp. S0819]KAB7622558.1 methylated-DNA--[protein]-cysteine S-methyltransferase [Alkalilimnicola sp. S0819]MPQ17445.1 methylated-DNA--[protein]-cysteine S-methyltransferase [Alkalilimnicola sp. S0819]
MSRDVFCLNSPVGRLGIVCDAGQVSRVILRCGEPVSGPRSELGRELARQLARWFEEPGAGFQLPLAPATTAHQQRVREALCAIPPGEVREYGALARLLGSGPRAIGGACARNPVPVLVPCHRVVARTGLGGFTGEGGGEALVIKRWLLAHEGYQVH